MNRTILVGKPYLKAIPASHAVRLCAELSIEREHVYTMWFEVEEKYGQYLCHEHSDPFVVVLLFYAMEHDLDIAFEQAMSERLYYQLTEYLLPCISENISAYSKIVLRGPVSGEALPCAGAVGAALSGGVDSFYTLMRHIDRGPNYSITHFAFFNEGACGEYGGEDARARYHERINWIQDVAFQLGREMVLVDGNASEFLQENHLKTHSFRTLSNVLALQKLFGKYYYSSTYPFARFRFDPGEPAYYELLIVHCLSTDNTTFYLSGGEITPLGKIRAIAEFPLTYNRLNVCVVEATNCSKCGKCKRRMLQLYCVDKLDLLFAVGNRKTYCNEVFPILKSKGEITLRIWFLHYKRMIYTKLCSALKIVPPVYNVLYWLKHWREKT